MLVIAVLLLRVQIEAQNLGGAVPAYQNVGGVVIRSFLRSYQIKAKVLNRAACDHASR